MSEIKIKDPDTLRAEREMSKMQIKEIAERCCASAALIHNWEYSAKHLGATLTQHQVDTIARLNRELDVFMRNPDVRAYFEKEVALGGTAVIWKPH